MTTLSFHTVYANGQMAKYTTAQESQYATASANRQCATIIFPMNTYARTRQGALLGALAQETKQRDENLLPVQLIFVLWYSDRASALTVGKISEGNGLTSNSGRCSC